MSGLKYIKIIIQLSVFNNNNDITNQQIELQITGADELALELEARYLSVLDAVIEASDVADEPEPLSVTVDSALPDTVAIPVAESSNTVTTNPPPFA